MRKLNNKLSIHRDTILVLSDAHVQSALGGFVATQSRLIDRTCSNVGNTCAGETRGCPAPRQ
jgi:hypothetical protein